MSGETKPGARLAMAATGGLLLIVANFVSLSGAVGAVGGQEVAGFAAVNGTRLHYQMKGAGKTVVLLHGGLVDSRLWDEQFVNFARRYRVIRYDLRGFGKSELPAAPFSHVADLDELLKFLKVEKAVIVGLSLGGIIAQEFALAHPAMVEKLILVGPGLRGFPSSDPEEAVNFYRRVMAAGPEGGADLWLGHPLFAATRHNPAARSKLRQMLVDNFKALPFLAPTWMQWPEPPTIERLDKISVPTLVVVGGADHPDLLAIADRLAGKIPGARKAVIAGASHHPNLEKPKEFNKLALDYLRGAR